MPEAESPQVLAAEPIFHAAIRWKIYLAAAALVLAGFAAYSDSFGGPFIFDDMPAIADNNTIQGEWWEALMPPPAGQTVTGRPLVNLTLALNYHLGGYTPWGYHVVNLAIHLLAGLALFGVVRRTLLLPSLRGKYGAASLGLALAAALLWMLHPLQTESITYIIQRAEALMGLFYLLTFYCFVRAVDSPRGDRWLALSFLSCLLGVFCKEVMVTAPVMVLLYDRTFVTGTFKGALRRRWGVYLALVATWIPLGWQVLDAGTRGGSAGFGAGVSWWAYAFSQYPAIIHYLWLCIWPASQTLDYGTGLAHNVLAVLPAQIAVMALVAGTVWALVRRPALGFLGAWFFVILSPSSSIVPITTETVAEHRLYVPFAAIAMLAVLGLKSLLGRQATLGAIALAAAFGALTFARNQDYRSATAIWADATKKNPDIARPNENYGIALTGAGRLQESVQAYKIALKLNPRYPDCESNLGSALLELGHNEEALAHFEKAARELPTLGQIQYSLGNAYRVMGRWDDAARAYIQATKDTPGYFPARGNLMGVYNEQGKFDKTIIAGKIALAWKPDFDSAHNNIANAYAHTGRPDLALQHYAQMVARSNATNAAAYWGMGNCLMLMNRPQDAAAWYRVGLAFGPRDATIHNNLGTALLRTGHTAEAINEYVMALKIAPNFQDAKNNLNNAMLTTSGSPLPSKN